LKNFFGSSWVKKSRVYIYLARLDKKGIDVVTAFESHMKVYPTRVRDVGSLGLERGLAHKVNSECHANKMTHELYAESAMSFEELKSALRKRGYTNLPMSQFNGYVPSTGLNKDSVVTEKSTMMRRASSLKR